MVAWRSARGRISYRPALDDALADLEAAESQAVAVFNAQQATLDNDIAGRRRARLVLAAVLVFVGVKMCLLEVFKIPSGVSLAVIALLLGGSIVWSLRATRASASASTKIG